MQTQYSNNYGLNNSYEYYEFVFDSSQATRANTSADLKENWPVFSVSGKKPLTNIAAMKILEVQIPFSYVATIRPNDVFTLTEGVNTQNVVVPAGNYTTAQLAVALKTALDAAHVALGGNPNAFTVSYLPSDRFSFLCFDGGPVVFTLNFTTTSPYMSIGFKVGSYTSNVGGSLIAPYYPNVTGAPYLYLNSNAIGTLIDLYLPQQNGNTTSGPQVAKVPVTAMPGETIYWQDPDPQKWFNIENLPSLQILDFYLTLGTETNLLDLQGLPFSLKLGVLLTSSNQTDVGSGVESVTKRMRTI